MTERSKAADEIIKQPVALPVGDVANMEMARRLSPDRTIRSTCYEEKLATLSPVDQARVHLMEELLYESAPRASICTLGRLHLPDSRFECSEGSIWFHYSKSLRKFVLGYFELNRRAGGAGSGGGLRACGGYGRRVSPSLGDSIAARLAQLLAAKRYDAYDMGLVAWLDPDQRHPGYFVRIDGLQLMLNHPAPQGKLLIDIAQSCRSLGGAGPASMLPSWSLLARTARVREQVENPYARAIFAGEALCRIGETIGGGGASGRMLLWGPVAQRSRRTSVGRAASALLEESAAILAAIRDGDIVRLPESKSCYFLTASLMDRDMLADVRRLALIRNEMMFRLAMAVLDPAKKQLRQKRATADRDQLRRYALLSEFVRVSAVYFGNCGQSKVDDDIVETLTGCAHKEHAIVRMLVRDLDDFGCSTALIVDELGSTDANETPSDPIILHERLLSIATEILRPSYQVH